MRIWAEVLDSDVQWPISKEWFENVEQSTGIPVRYEEPALVCVCTDGVLVVVPSELEGVIGTNWVCRTRDVVETYADFAGIYALLAEIDVTMAELDEPDEERWARAS